MTTTNSKVPAKVDDEVVDQVAPVQRQNDRPLSTQIDEKRARKRQLDRISQRRKRQKDRETMDRLKRNLAQPHDPTLLHGLVMKQEQDLARIHRHGERMVQIQAIIQADLADLEEMQPCGQYRNSQTPSSDDSSSTYHTGIKHVPLKPCPDTNAIISSLQSQFGPNTNTAIPPLDSHIDFNGLSWDDIEVPQLQERIHPSCVAGTSENDYADMLSVFANETSNINHGMFGSSTQHISPPNTMQSRTKSIGQPINRTEPPMTDEERLCVKGCESIWKAANLNIGLARHQYCNSLESQPNDSEIETDAHLMVTAITEGWDVAEQSPFWNDQWPLLRKIDEICHSDSGTVERLVILFNVRRMLKCLRVHNDQTSNRLPKFLHARPSQIAIPHAVVIDYFVWPGFREHVIFNHQRYCSNAFSRLFARSIKFLWPYEVRDTYVRNRETDLYHFSRTFLDQADDLRSYTLDSSFFSKYPEFHGDAPIYNPLPRPYPTIDAPNAFWQYFPTNQIQKNKRSIKSRHIDDME